MQEEKKQSEIDRLQQIEEALEKNSLALDADTVSNFYSLNFKANIKQASQIIRLSSINHEIDFSFEEGNTLAKITLKKGEESYLGWDFVLYFQNEKMFEPTCFT